MGPYLNGFILELVSSNRPSSWRVDRSSSLQSQRMWDLDGARCRAHLALRQAWACRKIDGKCVIRVCLCLGNCSLDDSKR